MPILNKPLGLFNEMDDLKSRLTEVETVNKSLKKSMKMQKYTNGEFKELKLNDID